MFRSYYRSDSSRWEFHVCFTLPQTVAEVAGAFVVVFAPVLVVATDVTVVAGLIDKVFPIVPVAL